MQRAIASMRAAEAGAPSKVISPQSPHIAVFHPAFAVQLAGLSQAIGKPAPHEGQPAKHHRVPRLDR
jgi:hypothetical protein